jgi:transcriptional regulator GlxA family with amidase domain
LLDIVGPDVAEAGLLATLEAEEHLVDVPVVVLTAQALTESQLAHLGDGITAVLRQGLFTAEETFAHIERALSGGTRQHGTARQMTRRVMGYIHEHYAEPLTRDALAMYVHVSPRHLTRCFVNETGISPMKYLTRSRILEAQELLRRGMRTISDIAGAVGFSSNAYFDVVFRRELGLAPSDYRHRTSDTAG